MSLSGGMETKVEAGRQKNTPFLMLEEDII
jgi:hypothetical protein